jgi:hypothetical protein
MTVIEPCAKIVSRSEDHVKVTLPSGQYAGFSFNLGSLETNPQTTASIKDAAVVQEDALTGFCNLMHVSASNNDRNSYGKVFGLWLDTYTKLNQLATILASNPTETAKTEAAGTTPSTPPVKTGNTSSTSSKPSKIANKTKSTKVSTKKGKGGAAAPSLPTSRQELLKRWLQAYGPASVSLATKPSLEFARKIPPGQSQSGGVLAPAAAPAAGPNPNYKLMAIPARDDSYFGIVR